jgi:PIN domain nuclease of toxin-antitoxin system
MRLLLDTHIYLWTLLNDSKLSKTAKKLISDADEVYVGSASVWEASIKSSLGKLNIDVSILAAEIAEVGFLELPVRIPHALMLGRLSKIHKDPFDRILIAQALAEPLNFLTADSYLGGYSQLVITV